MPSRNGRKYVARVSDLADNELHCHAYGHAWVPRPPTRAHDARVDQVVWVQQMNCARCPKVRTDKLDTHTFRRTGRSHYTEPDRFRVLEPIPRGRTAYVREAIQREFGRERAGRFRPV